MGILIEIKEIEIPHISSTDRWVYTKSYVPTYEYEVGLKKYRIKGSNGSGFRKGDTVKIYYNPSNPKECYIEGYSFGIWKVLLLLGIVFIVMALVFFRFFSIIILDNCNKILSILCIFVAI